MQAVPATDTASTAYHAAAAAGNVAVAELLYGHGAEPRLRFDLHMGPSIKMYREDRGGIVLLETAVVFFCQGGMYLGFHVSLLRYNGRVKLPILSSMMRSPVLLMRPQSLFQYLKSLKGVL